MMASAARYTTSCDRSSCRSPWLTPNTTEPHSCMIVRIGIRSLQRAGQPISDVASDRILAQSVPQRPTRTQQPHSNRPRTGLEQLRQRRHVQIMPVVKLEQELLLDRQPAQGRLNRRELLLLAELLAR